MDDDDDNPTRNKNRQRPKLETRNTARQETPEPTTYKTGDERTRHEIDLAQHESGRHKRQDKARHKRP